jgi:purine-binding chemotaxis protein CheW
MATTIEQNQYDDPEIPPDVLDDPLGAMLSDLLGAEETQQVAPDAEPAGVEEPSEFAALIDAPALSVSEEADAAPVEPPQANGVFAPRPQPIEPGPALAPVLELYREVIGRAHEMPAEEKQTGAIVPPMEPETFPDPALVLAAEVVDEPRPETVSAAVTSDESLETEPGPASEGLEELISEIDRANQSSLQGDFFAPEDKPVAARGHQDSCIVFLLSGTRYAIPIRNVLELDATPRVTAVPNVPGFVRGVTNLRGEIVVVLDLRTLLGLDPGEVAERGRILVVRTKDQQTAALAVDEVRGTAGMVLAQLAQPSGPMQDAVKPLLLGVGQHQDHVLNVLDVDRLFSKPELRQFTAN